MALLKRFYPYLLTTMVLMTIAFYNGYPMHDGDTHAYMDFGFSSARVCVDRSPIYGFFIRLTSLWTSLWLTAFCQCLLSAYVLVRYARLISPYLRQVNLIIAFAGIITLFTSAGWFCNTLSPHFFAATMLLAILLYLFDLSATRLHRILYVAVMAISITMHNSHFLISALFAIALIVFALFRRHRRLLIKCCVIVVMDVLFYLSMCTFNYNNDRGFVFSPSSQVFLIARLATNGVLKRYMDDNCEKKNLRLCKVKDVFPASPWDIMWPPANSPIAKTGLWDSCKSENSAIISDIITTPKYLSLWLAKSVTLTGQELCQVQVGPPAPEDDRPMFYFDDEYGQFLTSRQNNFRLSNEHVDMGVMFFLILSSIAVLLIFDKCGTKILSRVYGCIILFFIINAFVTANLSVVIQTYQSRIAWILPATNLAVIFSYFLSRSKKRTEALLTQDK